MPQPTTPLAGLSLAIEGMSCGHCVRRVTEVLQSIPGLEIRSVSVGSAELAVADAAGAVAVVTALAEAGYPARRARAEPGAPRRECCGSSPLSAHQPAAESACCR